MIPDLLCLASAPSTGPAVDRDTGREWVENELSKQEYSAADLTPLEQIGRWISSLWDSLVNAALRSNSPWLLLLVALALAAVIDASRAIFAVLSVKRIISLESSATASELAREAESALPDHAAAVHSVAEVFNDLLYGDRLGGRERPDRDLPAIYARLCEMDRTLSSLPAGQQEASA